MQVSIFNGRSLVTILNKIVSKITVFDILLAAYPRVQF